MVPAWLGQTGRLVARHTTDIWAYQQPHWGNEMFFTKMKFLRLFFPCENYSSQLR